MIVSHTIKELQAHLSDFRMAAHTIGFVPTMGALHEGHISLLEKAREDCTIGVVSIFVNPTQFNNQTDLEKYPRTIEEDLRLLEAANCDLVFIPSVAEMYPEGHISVKVDLGKLVTGMEGRFRPGHFDGVVEIVARLFEIVEPDSAYFGLKDFQQVAVIRKMVEELNMVTDIVACETLREPSGLAKSSRNLRLSEKQKEEASLIYKSLVKAKDLVTSKSPAEICNWVKEEFNNSDMELEYVEIVDPLTLKELDSEWVPGATMCIAAFCGEVRLIDNSVIVP